VACVALAFHSGCICKTSRIGRKRCASRYDAAEKLLTFLRVCPICGIEQVVETLEYEPRRVWMARGAAPQLAVLPVESSIPADTTPTQWRCRNLAA
jgi:hypothetical protein